MAKQIVRSLRERVYLNHVLLWNRSVERIEPGTDEDAVPVLEGPDPILLECHCIREGRWYFDERFAPDGTDPSRLVSLVPEPDSGCRLRFVGAEVPPENLRIAYLRTLDWHGLTLPPGRKLSLDGLPLLTTRAAVHPAIADDDHAQIRKTLAWRHLHEPADRVSQRTVADRVWQSMPAALRSWIDDRRTDERPFGMQILPVAGAIRHRPHLDSSMRNKALFTQRIILKVQPGAPVDDLRSCLRWLDRRIELVLPGHFVEIELKE